jgi:hypothetical protein
MISVALAIRPSISAVISPSVKRLRTGSVEVNRDSTSPMCRFSK